MSRTIADVGSGKYAVMFLSAECGGVEVIAQELGLQTAEQIAEAEVDPALEELRKKRGRKEPEDHAVRDPWNICPPKTP